MAIRQREMQFFQHLIHFIASFASNEFVRLFTNCAISLHALTMNRLIRMAHGAVKH